MVPADFNVSTLFIALIFYSIFLNAMTESLGETTPTTEGNNQVVTPEGASGYANAESTALAKLVSSIQSRPEVSEKVAPVVQDRETGMNKIALCMEYAVLGVQSADDVLQTIRTALHLKLTWMNPALAWNATEHSAVNSLEFSIDSIWTPKLLLINSVTQVDLLAICETDLLVDSSGKVTAVIPIYTETICDMDLTRYPYDEQSCSLVFIVLSSFADWKLEENSDTKAIVNMTGFTSTWTLEKIDKTVYKNGKITSPTISLRIKRKTVFYTVCLALPMTFTSYMNTMVFLIPPESGEKISFFVSVFVSNSVFISFFSDVMPRSLEIMPNVMKLLLWVLAQGLLILLATILILRRFHQEELSGSISKPSQNKGNRVFPLAANVTLGESVQDSFDKEEAERTSKQFSGPRSFPRTFSLSARQLDRVCFVVAVASNTSFLSYLFINTLCPEIIPKL